MTKQFIIISVLAVQTLIACTHNQPQATKQEVLKTDSAATEYSSENLTIRRISGHAYQHISYLQTQSFGKVDCNGMIVVNGDEAVIFDTPADNESSRELIEYLTKKRGFTINGVIPTHFHIDCLGGLEEFHKNNIPSFANQLTIEFAKSKNSVVPQNGFKNTLALDIGDKKVHVEFFGEGHTKDNVIGYFPDDEVLFGGCLIKETGAGKGNLEDANTATWPETVRKIKAKYPQAKVVIPGHGEIGGTELLDFTIELFEE